MQHIEIYVLRNILKHFFRMCILMRCCCPHVFCTSQVTKPLGLNWPFIKFNLSPARSSMSLPDMAPYGRWRTSDTSHIPDVTSCSFLSLDTASSPFRINTWLNWAKKPNSGCSSCSNADSSSSDGVSYQPCCTSVSMRTRAGGIRPVEKTCPSDVSKLA